MDYTAMKDKVVNTLNQRGFHDAAQAVIDETEEPFETWWDTSEYKGLDDNPANRVWLVPATIWQHI